MNDIKFKIRVAWSYVAPYITAVSNIIARCIAVLWSAVLVSLRPLWVPTLTLARNPLTAVFVGIMVLGTYIAGDRVRAMRDTVTMARAMRSYEARLVDSAATLNANAALFVREKAALVAELDAIKKQNDDLEAKLRGAKAPTKPVTPPKAKAAVAAPKAWSLF